MDRRNSLKIIGAVSVTCAYPFSADELYGQQQPAHEHGASSAKPAPAGPFTPKFLTAAELATVSRIADLIIPPTDTPGAVAAGVPQYIDTVLVASVEMQKRYREGIAWTDQASSAKHGKPFVQLTETQQIELLTPLSAAVDKDQVKSVGEQFFRAIKSMTADGYYTSQAGLVQELGYKGNVALAEFPPCTHEH
ncbi:MAG: lactose 3-dehydrogenase subunit gamma LacC [Vulcanimicrobiaceae bacterium]